MIKRLLIPTFTFGALLLGSTEALAGGFITPIDTFNVGEQFLQMGRQGSNPLGVTPKTDTLNYAVPPGIANQIVGGSSGISREITTDLTQNTFGNRAATLVEVIPSLEDPFINPGTLNIANAPGADSTTSIAWDGQGGGLGLDLTDGGAETLALKILNADLDVEYKITLFDEDGNSAFVEQFVTTPISLPNPEVRFFTYEAFLANNPSLNLSAIESIVLEVNGQSDYDTTIDFLASAEIPEPAMVIGSIVALGLGRFSYKSKRIA